MINGKKGLTTFMLIIFAFIVLLGVIMLGFALWSFNLIDDSMDVDVDIGNVNLADANNQTIGQIRDAFDSYADSIGVILIFGMAVSMILAGYIFGRRSSKLWIPIDFFILIFVFIIAVYFSQVYSFFINADPLISAIYIDSIPKTSKFLLHLPLYVSTLGIFIMIATYAIKGRGQEEGVTNVLGY